MLPLPACSQIEVNFHAGTYSGPEDFPKNWKTIARAEGDLNNDNKDDMVLVLADTKEEKYIANEGMGVDTLNTNQRVLVVLLKAGGKYSFDGKNMIAIPAENNTENVCLQDPFWEGGIKIANGVLSVTLQYFYSCGSWLVTNSQHLFRFQHNRFELIGIEKYSVHRSSGETSNYSYNFSTKQVSISLGGNEFSVEEDHPETILKKLRRKKPITMQNFSFDTEYEFQ